MSVGRPPANFSSFTASAPDRGSFPLDHEGECKEYMQKYLKCLRNGKNENAPCRELSKDYLACRMDKGLMARVEWEDLGYSENGGKAP